VVFKVTIRNEIRHLFKRDFDVVNINILGPKSPEEGCEVSMAISRIDIGRL